MDWCTVLIYYYKTMIAHSCIANSMEINIRNEVNCSRNENLYMDSSFVKLNCSYFSLSVANTDHVLQIQAFFGVFDGHGGVKAAEFAAKNMEINIRNEVTKRSEEGIRDAIREGYLTTDSQFLEEDVGSGTCCVTAMIRNGNLIVSNAGDCRAVMSRGGLAEALTVDHRPSRSDEKERIEGLVRN